MQVDILQGRDRSLGQTNTCQPSQVIAPIHLLHHVRGNFRSLSFLFLFFAQFLTGVVTIFLQILSTKIHGIHFWWRAIASQLQSTSVFAGVNFLTDLNEGFHVLLNFLPRYIDSPLTCAIAEQISLLERWKIPVQREQRLEISGQWASAPTDLSDVPPSCSAQLERKLNSYCAALLVQHNFIKAAIFLHKSPPSATHRTLPSWWETLNPVTGLVHRQHLYNTGVCVTADSRPWSDWWKRSAGGRGASRIQGILERSKHAVRAVDGGCKH